MVDLVQEWVVRISSAVFLFVLLIVFTLYLTASLIVELFDVLYLSVHSRFKDPKSPKDSS